MAVHVLGVRHHGPGSARSVAAALDELAPDAVVIEGAPELDEVAHLAADPAMRPPVAGLVYDVASPRYASFYPFAAFSPEWVALRWALARGVPVRFADLKATHALALAAAEREAELEAQAATPEAPESSAADDGETGDSPGDDSGADPAPEAERADPPGAQAPPEPDSPEGIRQDPIALLARAAGQSDPERWWDDAIEHRTASAPERFAHVAAAMAEVRAARPELDDDENRRREAAMRLVIREVAAEHETVAVVCGAFHAPALDPAGFPSRAADARLLRGLPKAKVAATWAPWTNDRLRYAGGYGAGVQAPGWYHHLFAAPGGAGQGDGPDAPDVETSWLVRTSRALRGRDVDAAPASTVEAVRLAQALAAVRGRPSAGLAELDDAALTVLAHGSEERLSLVRGELFVGDVLGEVPETTPMVPLAADLARTQKTLRLKPAAKVTTVTLDLRQEAQLARSTLFHRLRVLDVPWAEPAAAGRTTGTFKEVWDLEWRPEFAVAVIEASLYGTTIVDAAAAKVAGAADEADLPTLSALVEACLLADLPGGLTSVVARLGERSAQSHDLRELLATVEPLARTVRYGDVRGVDVVGLSGLLRVLVTRVCVGLAPASHSLDDDAAASMRSALDAAHRGIVLLDDDALSEPWFAALARLGDQVHGTVGGRVDRLLLDAGRIDDEEAARRMSRRLSGQPGPAAAAWVEAFLSGEAVLLLHDDTLLGLLDAWLAGVPEATFDDLLPLLRRTFAHYSAAERRTLGDRLGHSPDAPRDTPRAALDLEQALPAVRATARLLGLEVIA